MNLANVSYREVLKDQVIRGPGNGIPVAVGISLKGPINKPLLVTNTNQLLELFGESNNRTGYLHFAVSELLKTSSAVYAIRVKGNSELSHAEVKQLVSECLPDWTQGMTYPELNIYEVPFVDPPNILYTGPGNLIYHHMRRDTNGFAQADGVNQKYFISTPEREVSIISLRTGFNFNFSVELQPSSISMYIGILESGGENEITIEIKDEDNITVGTGTVTPVADPGALSYEEVPLSKISIEFNQIPIGEMRLIFNKDINLTIMLAYFQFCRYGNPIDYAYHEVPGV